MRFLGPTANPLLGAEIDNLSATVCDLTHDQQLRHCQFLRSRVRNPHHYYSGFNRTAQSPSFHVLNAVVLSGGGGDDEGGDDDDGGGGDGDATEAGWVLLQLAFDLDTMAELWVVPRQDMRLSQGAPLDVFSGIVKQHESCSRVAYGERVEKGQSDSMLMWKSRKDRIGGDWVDQRYAGINIIETQRLIKLLPYARKRFKNAVIDGSTDSHGYDYFDKVRNLQCEVSWHGSLPQSGFASYLHSNQDLIISVDMSDEARKATCGAAWGDKVFLKDLWTDRWSTSSNAFYLRKFEQEDSDELRPHQYYAIAVAHSPVVTAICRSLVPRHRGSNPLVFCLGTSGRKHQLFQISVRVGSESLGQSTGLPPLKIELDRCIPEITVLSLVDFESRSRRLTTQLPTREIICFEGSAGRQSGLFAMDVTTHMVARLRPTIEYPLLQFGVETPTGLEMSNGNVLQLRKVLVSSDELSTADFLDAGQWMDESARYDTSFDIFSSRCTDLTLLNAAFIVEQVTQHWSNFRIKRVYRRSVSTHPLRYWIVTGLGDVPGELRAPDGIYREMKSVEELGDYLGGIVWYADEADPKCIEEVSLGDWKGERRSSGVLSIAQSLHSPGGGVRYLHHKWKPWIRKQRGPPPTAVRGRQVWLGVIDVKIDGSTSESNLKIVPKAENRFLLSESEAKEAVWRAPLDETSRPYFEVTSGVLVAIDAACQAAGEGVEVKNAAMGRWYFGCDARLNQFLVWHESVDCRGKDGLVWRMGEDKAREIQKTAAVVPKLGTVETKWTEAQHAARMFLDGSGLPPMLEDRITSYMTWHPNSFFWKCANLEDGFAAHSLGVGMVCGAIGFFDASKFRDKTQLPALPEKLNFRSEVGNVFDRDMWDPYEVGNAHEVDGMALPSGAVYVEHAEINDELLCPMHCLISNETGKIICARLISIGCQT